MKHHSRKQWQHLVEITAALTSLFTVATLARIIGPLLEFAFASPLAASRVTAPE